MRYRETRGKHQMTTGKYTFNNVIDIVTFLSSSGFSVAKIDLPDIKKVDDISKYKVDISKYVDYNKNNDYVYYFPSKGKRYYESYFNGQIESSGKIECNNWCIAGSKALELFITNYKDKLSLNKNLNVVSNDTDIFFLDSKIPYRFNVGTTDIVHEKSKTVDELLLNFDLPCCRIATNSNGDWWISIQCIDALLSGKYYLPKYFEDFGKFYKVLCTIKDKNKGNVNSKFLYTRSQARCDKYLKRGFKYEHYDTDYVIPWITNRFFYMTPQLFENKY